MTGVTGRTLRAAVVASLLGPLGSAGCAAPPSAGGDPAPGVVPREIEGPDPTDVPVGRGTLRQAEITMSLRSGALQIRVTPLEEWMIRLTAEDTYDRLSQLATAHRPALEARLGVAGPTLFLVSVFTDEPSATYDPEDLQVVDRGRRYRTLAIRPVTAGWGRRRLEQQEAQMAVYAFEPGLELDLGMVVEYGDVRNGQWNGILQRLQSELARVRGRSRQDARRSYSSWPTSSSPYFRILR